MLGRACKDGELCAALTCWCKCNCATLCICMRWEPFTGFLFNDGLFWVAVTAEWNTMCAPSGRTFLLAPWFPKVIHAVLIPTVMALSWGSATLPGPPRFSLWPPWQHALQLLVNHATHVAVDGRVGGVKRMRPEAGANGIFRWFGKDGENDKNALFIQ